MKLDENFTLTSDSYGWTLVYKKENGINDKTEKPKISTKTTHHATMYQALKSYIDDCVKASGGVLEIKKLLGQALSNIAVLLTDIRSTSGEVDGRIERLRQYPLTYNEAFDKKK